MTTQQQFLDVIDRDEAERRFHAALRLQPLGEDELDLRDALGRVLSADVRAGVDVPSFDRSNFDGFAVRAADTYGAAEETPRRLVLLGQVLATGVVPQCPVAEGQAIGIATGGMLPRGADAVVMVEHTEALGGEIEIRKAVSPGFGVSFAGTDIAAGEVVLRRGEVLTSRETGVLAAIGAARVRVWKEPRVAVISTGDELIEPGRPMRPGMIYDSNARILADAVRELGGQPVVRDIVPDDMNRLRAALAESLKEADVVLLSGGTSKGQGDLCYQAVEELSDPGIVAHGVALKPGKPICLAAHGGKPVVVLPGFPTSAIFTFHEFVAPVIRRLGGRPAESRTALPARMAVKVNSEVGRTEYLLVGLVEADPDGTRGGAAPLAAFPMGKGSGSVTAFSRADGFVTIGRHEEIIDAGAEVEVQLLGRDLRPADLVAIGSHCAGLDYLLGLLQERGYHTKFLAVGSTGGLQAATRGECDLAGIHLLDASSGEYNWPFLTPDLKLVRGYGRRQGIVFRRGDERFEQFCTAGEHTKAEAEAAARFVAAVKQLPDCVMVNRNQGSGTRILIDRLLGGSQPPGYAVQARSHNAVAAAVVQERADWGMAIAYVAEQSGLGFLPLQDEQYDFVVPKARYDRPAVKAFRELLEEAETRQQLEAMGFALNPGLSHQPS